MTLRDPRDPTLPAGRCHRVRDMTEQGHRFRRAGQDDQPRRRPSIAAARTGPDDRSEVWPAIPRAARLRNGTASDRRQ